MEDNKKPALSLGQIWNMSFGFLGIQIGMGLQQVNMSAIYRYLGADEHSLPILWLAGPVTGLVVQPIIGAMSDGHWGRWGRRRPFFTIGAIIASICLVLMPYSSAVWMAAGLMWVLDAAVNTSMESFRAMIGDILPKKQRTLGFSLQTFMIGMGGLFIGFLPYILKQLGVASTADVNTVPDFVKYSFILGAIIILGAILWTGSTTKEYPPEDLGDASERKPKLNISAIFKEIIEAVKDMPKPMKQLWWVQLLVWFGLPMMWQYLSLAIARHVYNAPTADSPGFDEGLTMGGISNAIVYGVSPLIIAFFIPMIVNKIGTRKAYAIGLLIGALGFIGMLFTNDIEMIFALSFLIGIGNAALTTIPFIIVSTVVESKKMGVYMGILNTFICIPQIIMMLLIPLFYNSILGGDPRNAVVAIGICWIIAAVLCFRINKKVDFPALEA